MKVIDDARKEYVKEIMEVEKQFHLLLGTLNDVSEKSHRELSYLFDRFDSARQPCCNLSGEFFKITEYVKDVYSPMLDYQTGLNLIDRVRALKRIDRNTFAKEEGGHHHYMFFWRKKKYGSLSPEDRLRSSKLVHTVLSNIYGRIPVSNEEELFTQGYKWIEVYKDSHEQIREPLSMLSKKLKSKLRQNSYESIKLEDMGLSLQYKRLIGDIDRVLNLTFFDLRDPNGFLIDNSIGKLIYAGSVMHMVGHFDSRL